MNILKFHYLRVIFVHFNEVEIAESQLPPGYSKVGLGSSLPRSAVEMQLCISSCILRK